MAYGQLSEVYDKLIYEDINYESIAEFILEICKEHNISYENYLDLACGTGNLTIPLAKNFKNIFAVDISEEMLVEAYEKLRAKRLNGKVICQDMCELDLNKKFNLITVALDGTNYITDEDDLRDYFEAVQNHLAEDGLFVFDINSAYKLAEVLGNNIYTYNEEDVFYTWENVFSDEIVSMYLTFFIKRGDLYERFDEEHIERAYEVNYLEEVLNSVGLEIIKIYDNYSYESVQATTERIVFIVKKRKV